MNQFKYFLAKSWLITAFSGLLFLTPVNAADLIRVDYLEGTFLKATTGQSSSLPASQKCELNAGDIMEYESITSSANHFHITLPRVYPGCALSSGYLYQPHVSTHATSLTVHINTVFKKSTAQSTTLPPNEKCDLGQGIYKTSNNPSVINGHHQVNFAAVPPGCGFSSGYVAVVHSASGIQGMTLRSSAWLKTSTANSSTLPNSQKCLLDAGDYVLADAPDTDDNHYQVSLANSPAGCGFSSGFVYYFNTTFNEPDEVNPPSTSYTWPQPGSDLGSGWCVCRNIGSSPHIGQDFVQYGHKEAVAIQSGTITSSTFSSSCGHIVLLEDDFGSVWRYVHLNQPLMGVGSRVQNGQKLANISAYPRSGCGTGPHLHFERRSSGAFGDSATGRSCQNGFRSCYYDPIKPFRNSKNYSDHDKVSLPFAASPAVQSSLCKIPPDSYPVASELDLASYQTANHAKFNWSVDELSLDDQHSLLEAKVALVGNPKNQCDAKAGLDCIVSWAMISAKPKGHLKRLFVDASVRNQPVARVYEERFCLPQGHKNDVLITLQLASGEKWLIKERL